MKKNNIFYKFYKSAREKGITNDFMKKISFVDKEKCKREIVGFFLIIADRKESCCEMISLVNFRGHQKKEILNSAI